MALADGMRAFQESPQVRHDAAMQLARADTQGRGTEAGFEQPMKHAVIKGSHLCDQVEANSFSATSAHRGRTSPRGSRGVVRRCASPRAPAPGTSSVRACSVPPLSQFQEKQQQIGRRPLVGPYLRDRAQVDFSRPDGVHEEDQEKTIREARTKVRDGQSLPRIILTRSRASNTLCEQR